MWSIVEVHLQLGVVVTQAVKDVVQGLVDDKLIDTDRIGASTYFWSFPSESVTNKRSKLQTIESSIAIYEADISELKAKFQALKQERQESEDRTAKLEEVQLLRSQLASLTDRIERYAFIDPERVDAQKREFSDLLIHANAWTDNIFQLRSYCRNVFLMEENDFNANFGVPADMDYIEC